MAKEYVYKINHKFIKKPYLLEKFGFHPYEDEETHELIVAMPIVLPLDSSVVQSAIKLVEHIYKNDSEKEKEEDFKDYQFDNDGKIILNEELEKEFTHCQLCFYDKDVGAFQLFINAPGLNQYFNSKVLDENIGEIIKTLLENKVIYKKKLAK